MVEESSAGSSGVECPKISIVIPVYNAEAHLDECLSSCQTQTLQEIEIICVDDASTDSSRIILDRYADQDARFKVVEQPCNMGTHEARRAGFSLARAEYVLTLDADDTLDSDCCMSVLMNVRQSDLFLYGVKPFSAVASPTETLLARMRELEDSAACCDCATLDVDRYLGALFINESAPLFPAGKVFRRNLALSVFSSMPKGYCAGSEDGLLLVYLLAGKCSVSSCRKSLYNYRMGSGISTSASLPYLSRCRWFRSGAYCEKLLKLHPPGVSAEILKGVKFCLVERPYAMAFSGLTLEDRTKMLKSFSRFSDDEFAQLLTTMDATGPVLSRMVGRVRGESVFVFYFAYAAMRFFYFASLGLWKRAWVCGREFKRIAKYIKNQDVAFRKKESW